MSQVIKNLAGGGPLPPNIPTSFVTDNGTVVAQGNVVQINGSTSTANNANGITVVANPTGTKFELVQLTNRAQGGVTTNGAQTLAVITLPLGATPGTYTVDCSVAGFATAGLNFPLGAGYTIVGAVRTNGVTAFLIPTAQVDHFEEGDLAATAAVLAVSGNNLLINVTGAAGYTIDWVATLLYTLAT